MHHDRHADRRAHSGRQSPDNVASILLRARSPSVAWPNVPDKHGDHGDADLHRRQEPRGIALSARARPCAPTLPASASGCSRAVRAETSAISAIAKKPFSRISRRTTAVAATASLSRWSIAANPSTGAATRSVHDRVKHGTTARCRNLSTELTAGPSPGRTAEPPTVRARSARIELDDQVRLHRHRIGHVGELRRADEAALHACRGRSRGSRARRARSTGSLRARAPSASPCRASSMLSPSSTW